MSKAAIIAELRSSISQIESAAPGSFDQEAACGAALPQNRGHGPSNAYVSASGRAEAWHVGKREAHSSSPSPSASGGSIKTEADRALSKVIAVLNAGDKSEKALRERLSREGYSRNASDEAIAKAKECGFVDDLRYADLLIRSRVAQGRGSMRIERELLDNGIDPASVSGWPADYHASPDDETERALDLLHRKPPKSKNPRESAFRKLVNKGYPTSVASFAARTWWEETHLD